MNYYYEPEVAAQVAAYVNYICPVVGAQEVLAKTDPSSPIRRSSSRRDYIAEHNVQGVPGAHGAGGRRLQRRLGQGGGQLMPGFREDQRVI